MYRRGSLGVRVADAALALIGRHGIQLGNARFTQLARRIRGPLSPLEPEAGPAHRNLRRLVLAHAQPLLDRRSGAAKQLRYRDDASGAVIAVHLELSATSGERLVMALVEDSSDNPQRDEELRATREAVLHRERLRVLGELAASIAHDLGNTLRGASFQLATLRETAMPAQERAAAVDAVARRVEVASEAISRLHDFARTGSLGISAVRLDRIVAQAVALLDVDFHAASKPIEVRVRIPDLPQVRGSVAELSLLFVNLLRNARDAMPAGGTVTVAARRQKDCVLVTVTDQGAGIPPDVQARLFEPFFTTKGPSGTGLGLWLAAGTMKRLGGSIRAARTQRGGAAVLLRFPVVKPGRPADPRRGSRRGTPSKPFPRRRSGARLRRGQSTVRRK